MAGECRSWVEVSTRQIAANFHAIESVVGPGVEVACVVKADAYGHGAVQVSRALSAAGARWMAVSCAEEGVELRQAGIETRVLVLSDAVPSSFPAFAEYQLTPALPSFESLEAFDAFAARMKRRLPFHLKLDTGMGRFGFLEEADTLATAVRGAAHLEFEGVMSHLASASDYGSPQTEEQMRRFEDVTGALCRAGLVPRYRHLSSSAPVVYGRREAWFNLVRPGIALYGYPPLPSGDAPVPVVQVRPALAWKAAVLAVKDVPAGQPIGYGAQFRAAAPMRIAVIGAGYADGVARQLSNRARVIAGGKPVPVLGAVSMDVTTIDITACPNVHPGDAVTLIGSDNGIAVDADELAGIAGTISYDILCGIGNRVKRVYV